MCTNQTRERLGVGRRRGRWKRVDRRVISEVRGWLNLPRDCWVNKGGGERQRSSRGADARVEQASGGGSGNSQRRADVAAVLGPGQYAIIDTERPLQRPTMIDEGVAVIKEKIMRSNVTMKAGEVKALKRDVKLQTVAARFKAALGERGQDTMHEFNGNIPGPSGAQQNNQPGLVSDPQHLTVPLQYEAHARQNYNSKATSKRGTGSWKRQARSGGMSPILREGDTTIVSGLAGKRKAKESLEAGSPVVKRTKGYEIMNTGSSNVVGSAGLTHHEQ